MKKTALILFCIVFIQMNIFSDAPWEKFYVTKDNLPTDLLKKGTGILTLNSGIKRGIDLDIFDDNFKKTTVLDLRISKPFSNFGYHPPLDTAISNYRYLIIDQNEDYIKIVYDIENKSEAWISRYQLESRFYVSIKYFNELKTDDCFLSIFDMLQVDQRKVYSMPDLESECIVLSRSEKGRKLLKIIDQKGDFVKLGLVYRNEDVQSERVSKVLGWIKIRNENNAINVWIFNVDLC
ncbi:hypothetical protein [Saccharicrinis sp. FJH54]|uniref:hypothetical protein n=1 Tax=Saccharicrinis sp. FJH54 TaxID=3344665 RepID=UPI0035D428F6